MTNRHSIYNTILVCAVLLCCLLCQLSAAAQSDTLLGQRIKTRYYQIGLGASDVLDTYLSRQKGTGIALVIYKSFFYQSLHDTCLCCVV